MNKSRNLRIGRPQRRVRPHRAMRMLNCKAQATLMATYQISVTGLREAERLKISLEDILLALGYKQELVQMLATKRYR